MLDEIVAAGDKSVPRAIMEKAEGCTRVSVADQGRPRRGRAAGPACDGRDKKNRGWSSPAFLTITGVSIVRSSAARRSTSCW